MKEIGIISSTQGSSATVIIQRSSACGACGACQVGKENLTMEARAINDVKAKTGDKVEVEMAFKNVMKAAFIAYGVPLIMFILGCILGTIYTSNILGQPENPILSFSSGSVFMALTYAVIKIFDNKGIFKITYEPHITTILDESEQ